MRRCGCWLTCILVFALGGGCGDDSETARHDPTPGSKPVPSASPAVPTAAAATAARDAGDASAAGSVAGGGLDGPTLLLAQAQFFRRENPEPGQPRVVPGPARLVILRPDGARWSREVLEDEESNVFHKAVVWTDPLRPEDGRGILTIAAEKAALKFWRPTPDGWQARTLWEGTFGGKWDRLRDVEIGDVTGDGRDDIVIVTHDQGVVLVLRASGTDWVAEEIDRVPERFVHEVELADLDGDGLREIYATPSQPNRFDGRPQPGEIVVYRHTAEGFAKEIVEAFPLRHVKEILACEPEGAGRPVLLASVEGELARRAAAPPEAQRAFIKRYHVEDGTYVGEVVGWLPGSMCRFLVMGDVDGDRRPDLVAATYKKGLWWAKVGPGEWSFELIEAVSGGFEHATTLADLDGNGVQEVYVAADTQQEVRRHTFRGDGWNTEVLAEIEDEKLTFNIFAIAP